MGKKNRTQAQTTGPNNSPKVRPDKGTWQGNTAQAASGEATPRAWVKPASARAMGQEGRDRDRQGAGLSCPHQTHFLYVTLVFPSSSA